MSFIYATLGASNHSAKERQSEDFYATDPKAAELLCDVEKFSPKIWEPACGQGHLSEVFRKRGYEVRSTDLIDRGYGEQMDFLFFNTEPWDGDIITNPPYRLAKEFVYQALTIIRGGIRCVCFYAFSFWKGKRGANSLRSSPRRWYMYFLPGCSVLKMGTLRKINITLPWLMRGLFGRRVTRVKLY